jgi:hypothetical protein
MDADDKRRDNKGKARKRACDPHIEKGALVVKIGFDSDERAESPCKRYRQRDEKGGGAANAMMPASQIVTHLMGQ